MHSQNTFYKAMRRILDGVAYKDIAKELGVSIRTLAYWRWATGLKPLKPGPKSRRLPRWLGQVASRAYRKKNGD